MAKVSVIVPNYNHQNFLRKRLDSVFHQTFKDFDVLLMDDSSSDGSVEILTEYAEEFGARLMLNGENSGNPFKQWNKGLDNVSGDYVWIAESDDYAELNFLETLVKALDENPKAGIAYCQSWLVPRSGAKYDPVITESMHEMFIDHRRWQVGFCNSGKDELANYLAYKNTIPNASGVLIRKSVIQDNLRAPENMQLAGDWMFWTKILLMCDVVFVPKPLNYFREPHTGSQRDRTRKQALEFLEGLDIYAYIRERVDIDEPSRKKILRYHVKIWGFLSCLRRFTWAKNKEVYNKFLDVHREFENRKYIYMIIPFVIYYIAAPLRKVPVAMVIFTYTRRARHKIRTLLST